MKRGNRQNAEFRRAVAAFAKNCVERPEQTARATMLGMARSVIFMSPVDTGRFRGNWQLQFDLSPTVRDNADKAGGATLAEVAQRVREFTLAMSRMYLLNHLPYSIELEYGHSKQAPAGMVRLTVQRYRQIVEAAAREVSR